MDKEFLALEAERLAKDPVFLEALARMRANAIESLLGTNADDKTAIITLQATAQICDRLPSELQAMIQSSKDRKPKTVV